MRSDALQAIGTISRRARLLLMVLAFGLFLGAIYLGWQVVYDRAGFTHDLSGWLGTGAYPVTLTGRALGALAVLGLVNAGIAGTALLSVWRLFGLLSRGQVFARGVGVALRRAGGATLAGAVSTVVSRTAAALILTFDNPPGQKILLISVGSSEALLLLAAALLYAMGHVLALAADIERENRSFV